MSVDLLAVAAVVVLLVATVTGYTGFAFNLLTVPLLSFVMPVKQAVVIALVLGLTVSCVMIARNRGDVQWRTLWPVAIGVLPGTALGTYVFAWVSEDVLRVCVGVLTVVLALHMLIRRGPARGKPHRALGPAAGALGGTLSALTGMGGPPVVAYLSHVLSGSSAHIRATVVALAGGMQLTSAVAHGVSGSLTTSDLGWGLALAPCAITGVLLGSRIFRRAFRWYSVTVAVVLVVVGIMGAAMPIVATRS